MTHCPLPAAMRSRDDTFFNIKRLHLVFAVSSVALLAVTVWMVAADHYREWKVYQRTYRDRVEPWLTEARIREAETDEFLTREKELAEALTEARSAVPDRGAVARFRAEMVRDAAIRDVESAGFAEVDAAYQAMVEGPDAAARRTLLIRLRRIIDKVAVRETNLQRRQRFGRADLDEARSGYEIAVGHSTPQDRLDRLQARVDRLREQVDTVSAELDQTAAHREALRSILAGITDAEDEASKALLAHRAERDRLRRALAGQTPSLAKDVFGQPLIDALGRPLAIEQIWLPELTIDYNFRQVARFDRCVTCHRGIANRFATSEVTAACQPRRSMTLRLPRPEKSPEPTEDEEGSVVEPTLRSVHGLELAPRGVLEEAAPTVGMVLPRTPAAEAGLYVGDVILQIDGEPVVSGDDVRERLLAAPVAKPQAAEGAFSLEVVRGLPQPYCAHPRLDLFVGPRSPHPMTEFGCTICHDGQGSGTEFKWASHTPNDPAQQRRWRDEHGWFRNRHWDFPMMPERFSESRCLKCHHAVTDLAASERFPDPPAPKLLAGYHLIREHGCFGCHEIKGIDVSGRQVGPDMRLEPAAAALEQAPPPVPGTMRKVGPGLRDTAAKVDARYLADRMADPRTFLPTSRMPRFFGLHEPLDGKALQQARRLEPVEMRAAAEYLLSASQTVELLAAASDVTEPPSAERGKRLFQLHGCLACHQHRDFPEGQATQAPDLSDVGAKYTEAGRRWLVSWIRDPSHHNPRTVMPNALLEPVLSAVPGEADKRQTTDPTADIAAYLLASNGWTAAELPAVAPEALDELVLLYLEKTFPRAVAEEYVREGIPKTLADRVTGDTAELLGPITSEKKLRYVGRRTIARRGCFGCHDIPGFELTQPIGPALSDWGRKQESLLAFEQVHRLLEIRKPEDADQGFYLDAVRGKRREGFIWQKLRGPRSFDYKKAGNKPYPDWLTMGRFNFTPPQREAIMTFVLGLVADPPAQRYVYQPDRRHEAIVEGRKVLDRYACAECHALAMERWRFEYDPDEFEPPPPSETHAMLRPRFTPAEVAASLATDRRGRGIAEVVGMPVRGPDGGVRIIEGDEEDEEGEPLPMLGFQLWEPAVINGEPCSVGGADLLVYEHQIIEKRPPLGGAFARLLYPFALAEGRAAGGTVSGMEPWGWVPPPLVGEGKKVRPVWLHDYLLNPTVIRPASVLRMPRYNLSTAEASALVDYFAAAAGGDPSYAPDPRDRFAHRAATVAEGPERLDDAMRIVTDRKTFCAKCHLVGDFSPGEDVRTTLAPNLESVGRRLRPDYLWRWLADPKSALPYTGMPVNFPPVGEPLGQNLLEGTSREQLDAVTDLLLQYERYISRRTSIRKLIESTEEAPAAKEP